MVGKAAIDINKNVSPAGPEVLVMDTEVGISHNFLKSWNTIILIFFFPTTWKCKSHSYHKGCTETDSRPGLAIQIPGLEEHWILCQCRLSRILWGNRLSSKPCMFSWPDTSVLGLHGSAWQALPAHIIKSSPATWPPGPLSTFEFALPCVWNVCSNKHTLLFQGVHSVLRDSFLGHPHTALSLCPSALCCPHHTYLQLVCVNCLLAFSCCPLSPGAMWLLQGRSLASHCWSLSAWSRTGPLAGSQEVFAEWVNE